MTGRWQTWRDAVRTGRLIAAPPAATTIGSAELPPLAAELGLRPLENGRPAGPFQCTSELLAGRLDQQQLDVAPTHSP